MTEWAGLFLTSIPLVPLAPAAKVQPTDFERLHHANREGDELYYRGEWSEALVRFDEVVSACRRLPQKKDRPAKVTAVAAESARNLAMLHFLRGNLGEFEDARSEAQRFARRLGGPERWRADCDLAMVDAYVARQRGRFREALDAIERIPPAATEPNRVYLRARSAVERANVARNLGYFEESVAILGPLLRDVSSLEGDGGMRSSAREILRVIGEHFQGVTWMERASCFNDVEAIKPATEALQRSLERAQGDRAPSIYSLYVVRNRKALGWLHCVKGEHDRAERIAQASLETSRALGDVKTQALSLVLLAASHLGASRYEDARSSLDQALAIAERAQYWRGLVAVWSQLGRLATRVNDRALGRRAIDTLDGLRGALASPLVSRAIEDICADWPVDEGAAALDAHLVTRYELAEELKGLIDDGNADEETRARFSEVVTEIKRLEGELARHHESEALRRLGAQMAEARRSFDATYSKTQEVLFSLSSDADRRAEAALRTVRYAVVGTPHAPRPEGR